MGKKQTIDEVKVRAVQIAETRMVDRDEQGRPIPGKEMGLSVIAKFVFLNQDGMQITIEGKGSLTFMEKMPKGLNEKAKEQVVAISPKTKKALSSFMAAIKADVKKKEGI